MYNGSAFDFHMPKQIDGPVDSAIPRFLSQLVTIMRVTLELHRKQISVSPLYSYLHISRCPTFRTVTVRLDEWQLEAVTTLEHERPPLRSMQTH